MLEGRKTTQPYSFQAVQSVHSFTSEYTIYYKKNKCTFLIGTNIKRA